MNGGWRLNLSSMCYNVKYMISAWVKSAGFPLRIQDCQCAWIFHRKIPSIDHTWCWHACRRPDLRKALTLALYPSPFSKAVRINPATCARRTAPKACRPHLPPRTWKIHLPVPCVSLSVSRTALEKEPQAPDLTLISITRFYCAELFIFGDMRANGFVYGS